MDNHPQKILLIFNTSMDFVSSRLSLVNELAAQGYQVSIILPRLTDFDIKQYPQYQFYQLSFNRRDINPITQILILLHLKKLIDKITPDLIIAYRVKLIVYTAILNKLFDYPRVICVFTGLGYTFTKTRLKARLIGCIIRAILRRTLQNIRVIFQNNDDLNECIAEKLVTREQSNVILGSGVDIERFSFHPLPDSKTPIVLLISRLQRNKGIVEYLNAIDLILKKNQNVNFVIIGRREPEDIDRISEKEYKRLQNHPKIEWVHKVLPAHIPQFLIQSTIVCLPSYREGLPRVLLEAAAIGRPIVTTNTPGCREVVIPNENGFLVLSRNANAIAHAILTLLSNHSLCIHMGQKSRQIAEKSFSITNINQEYVKICNEVLKPES